MDRLWGEHMMNLMVYLEKNNVIPGYGEMTLPQLHDALEKKTKLGVSGVATPEEGAKQYLAYFEKEEGDVVVR